MEIPSLTGCRRVNDDISRLATPPTTAAPVAETTIGSSSNDNKKRRRASSDIQAEVECTELNNRSSDSKRSQRAARRGEDEIKNMYRKYRSFSFSPYLLPFLSIGLTLLPPSAIQKGVQLPAKSSLLRLYLSHALHYNGAWSGCLRSS